MKKRFTILTAVFALLAILAIPMGMWGQGNYSATYSSNCTLTAGTNGSNCNINVGTEGYNGIKVGTSSKGGDMSVTVPARAKYLHIHVAAWNGVDNLSLNITPNENVAPTSVALTANSGIANSSPFTFSGDPSTSDYYKVITFTEALTSETVFTFTTSIAKRFVIWGVNSEEEGSNPPTPTCATPTFSPAAGTYTQAQNVSISCATEGATIYYTTNGNDPTTSSSVYSTPLTISQTTTVKAIAVKDGYDDSSVASATYTIAQSVSGYTIDFEQSASLYTDWTFTSIKSQVLGTTDVPAHDGSYYGSTDGKTSGTIVTKTAIATPNTLTCYLSKASNNTTTSTWYVEVSSNGSDWTQAGSHSATNMDKGKWVEFTTNLSNYSNVYVRIRYDGTTAVRCIDDVVLNTEAPAIATPVISPESGTFETTQEVTITCATEGATIYYTTNGDDPTNVSSEYTGAFTLTETATVKAIAYNGIVYSTIASATYTKLDINSIIDITSATSYTVKGKIFANLRQSDKAIKNRKKPPPEQK